MIARIRSWRSLVNSAARNHPILLAVVLMLAVVVPGYLRVQHITDNQARTSQQLAQQQRDRDAFTACMASWADQYTARAERVSKLSATTTAALAANTRALNVVIGDAIRQDQAALARDIPTYQAAAEAYNTAAKASVDALRTDPIPDAPKFQCR